MKWVPWGVKMLGHPSLLPIVLAMFVTVAGPGGVAELGHNMPADPIVAVAPNTPSAPADEHTDVLLVRVVHETGLASVGPVGEAETSKPAETEELVATALADPSGTDQGPAGIQDHQQITPGAEPDQRPPDAGDPPDVSNPPDQPADDPADNTGGGAGDAGDDADHPADDDAPSDSPPQDEGGAGEEPPDGNRGDNGTGNAGGDACDVPGNGHDKHDVEPGHDKNNDGIDDRCEPDQGGDEGTADDQCDVPGNGHNHPVEPGHDKDGDGTDNRCQQNGDGENNDGHDGNNNRKDDG